MIRDLVPYVPGEQPSGNNIIKVNTNENPYPPSPMVIKAIHGHADKDLRLYPDPDGNILKTSIASFFNVDKKNVFIGNGSKFISDTDFFQVEVFGWHAGRLCNRFDTIS